MQIRGPLATLLAVVVAGAAVVATNLVLTDGPAPERTASLGLSRSSEGHQPDGGAGGDYGGDAYGGGAGSGGDAYGAAPAPGATAAPQAAAPGAAAPSPSTYDGRSSGNEVTVALTIEDGGAATAYVCDGKGLESWMRGTVQGSDLRLTGKDGGQLDGRTTEDRAAFGTVQVGDKSWPFAAAAPKKPATSGNAPTGGWS